MEKKYWNDFENSGKIEDYLKYKGIENIDGKLKGGLSEATESKGSSDKGDTL